MLSIDRIVQYVVQRLSSEGEFFRQASGESIRTVCNIVCYLGTFLPIQEISRTRSSTISLQVSITHFYLPTPNH